MATEITMPQLSDTMSSGKILSWSKNVGDVVKRGDILAEVETDKANLEIEAFHSGTILQIVVPAGQVATVGGVIAYVGAAGESVGTPTPSPSSPPPAHAPAPTPSLAPSPILAPSSPPSTTNDRIKVSPLARKIAEQKNIPLTGVVGSGPEGRIVRKDIEQAVAPTMAAPAAAPQIASTPKAAEVLQFPAQESTAPRAASTGPIPGQLVPMSKVRETIARRMQQTVIDSPHFFVTTSICMDEAFKIREILKEQANYKGMSINHLVIKAAAFGIAQEPRVHYAVRENNMVFQPSEINIGIITALDDGLLIPVIRQADKLSMKDIVFEAKAAVDRARAGRPSASDLVGGTFSISNMGMYDVENFTALINPGQGSILAVSSTKDEAIVKNGNIVAARMMKATISVDHRIIDGGMASNFLKYFKLGLENPALLFA